MRQCACILEQQGISLGLYQRAFVRQLSEEGWQVYGFTHR